ncbi:hypothetical protein I7I48_04992 [Histoplasma ohiense]|nr:hypothetical protein I7I48_04992 [Histoplasma ohiense (nom. inval.)]
MGPPSSWKPWGPMAAYSLYIIARVHQSVRESASVEGDCCAGLFSSPALPVSLSGSPSSTTRPAFCKLYANPPSFPAREGKNLKGPSRWKWTLPTLVPVEVKSTTMMTSLESFLSLLDLCARAPLQVSQLNPLF